MDQEVQERIFRTVADEIEPPPESYAQPHHRLPAGMSHAEGIGEVGRLTSEVMLDQYRLMVNAIEGVGKQLDVVDSLCEDVKASTASARQHLTELATRYEEQGRASFDKIQAEAMALQKDLETIRDIDRRLAAAG